MDRIFFNYHHFHNAVSDVSGSAGTVQITVGDQTLASRGAEGVTTPGELPEELKQAGVTEEFAGTVVITIAGGDRRFKHAEGNPPFDAQAIARALRGAGFQSCSICEESGGQASLLGHELTHVVQQGASARTSSVDRFTFGMERTFMDGRSGLSRTRRSR